MDREPPGSHGVFESSRDLKGRHGREYIPHFDTTERVQHVIFRCADSVPSHLSADTNFDGFDATLDRGFGKCLLTDVRIAAIGEATMLFHRDRRYRLLAWCIMPNHVHAALETMPGYRLGDLLKGWKTYSARRVNALTGAKGSFWARDYFDRFMRNEEHLATAIHYIVENPVKAGLAAQARDWRWSSIHDIPSEPGGSRSECALLV